MLESWGRLPGAPQRALRVASRSEPLPASTSSILPRGLGRSYGDVCLNDDGGLLLTRGLDHFIAFDAEHGRLRCEAGVSLAEILALALPRGWFLPVSPGTKFVTVGGAIANDVHGKNHHRVGSFGNHVVAFELLRSDGSRRLCSARENSDWFGATIGGLGLTGLITWVELQLRRVQSPTMEVDTVRFGGLEDFFALSREADASHEYTVAWIDCLARGPDLGRGLFMRANHAEAPEPNALRRERPRHPRWSVPLAPPLSPVNALSLRLYNTSIYRLSRTGAYRQHYDAYFYPLDGVGDWNRLYGPRGFYQYQCVVGAEAPIAEMIESIARAGAGSFLAVLKAFGSTRSPGWLSFARPGYTLALDFPNRGADTLRLFDGLDRIVLAAGGAVYPAKDARMGGELFRSAYPRWQELEQMRDPQFSSNLWRRVTRT
jgi:FAD/FMN-containing dehydrogenase